MVYYTGKIKTSDNYTDDIKRDRSKENGCCVECVYVGENDAVSNRRLCAETMSRIDELSNGFGHCDKCKICYKWYNQINPIKKCLLERTGFKFKNR